MSADATVSRIDGPVLITGGAGFIGTNLAARLLDLGREVAVFDNLSRPGATENLRWLALRGGPRLLTRFADTRDEAALREAVARAARIYHFAAQVAVASSLVDPLHDFDINLRGTLNLLEAIRRLRRPPPLVYTSTTKVYGGLPDIEFEVMATRWQPRDETLRHFGVGESRPLDFCSPCGCSKGGADQYVLGYARSFGIPAVVLRMSCIYGPHPCGRGEHGWIAHFLRRALTGQPITIHGDGLQVRDILHVDDLVDALLLCGEDRGDLRGRAFNIGGGPGNTVSIAELLELIGMLHGRVPKIERVPWRESDRRWFVTDTRRFRDATGWHAQVRSHDGVARLLRWLDHDHAEEEAQPIGAHAA